MNVAITGATGFIGRAVADRLRGSGHNVRADSVNELMFGSGPARRFIGEMNKKGPVAEEVIPGGESGVPGSPFQTDQLLLWLTNHYHPWPYRPADVVDAAVTDEVLTP